MRGKKAVIRAWGICNPPVKQDLSILKKSENFLRFWLHSCAYYVILLHITEDVEICS